MLTRDDDCDFGAFKYNVIAMYHAETACLVNQLLGRKYFKLCRSLRHHWHSLIHTAVSAGISLLRFDIRLISNKVIDIVMLQVDLFICSVYNTVRMHLTGNSLMVSLLIGHRHR